MPSVAEIVAVSPLVPPGSENVGVVSLVRLSVLDEPVSDAATRSGALVGAVGEVVSIATVVAALGEDTCPAALVTVEVMLQSPSVRPVRSHDCVPVPMT